MTTDPRIDAYIAESAPFAREILTHARALLHTLCPDIEETVRWRMPSFNYNGRPFAQMAAFKSHAAFGLWYRAPGRDQPEGAGQFGRLTSLADLPADDVLIAMIREAMAVIESGATPKRAARPPKPEAAVPEDLVEALAHDDAAAATFAAFSPSARRDYCDWISEAKRAETRAKRVAEAIAQLREGKKRNWKYESC